MSDGNGRALKVWVLAASAALLGFHSLAFGMFTSGVETFDGKVLDTAAWQSYLYNSTITQDGALYIHSPYNTDYTTRSLQVGVGWKVSVDVTMTVPPPAGYGGYAALYLTTNNLGKTASTHMDSAAIKTELSVGAFNGCLFMQTHDGDGYGYHVAGETDIMGLRYTLGIERQSPTLATGTIADSSGRVLGRTVMTINDIPNDLYISLWVQKCDVIFDNVSVAPIPEPCATMLLLLGGAASVLRRRSRP